MHLLTCPINASKFSVLLSKLVLEPWFDMYLRDRRPVALNHNPFMSVIQDPTPEKNHPV